MKKSRKERRAYNEGKAQGYNEGKAQGYNEGYEQGLHDGNPFMALIETVKRVANDPKIQQALKEAEEQYLNTLEIVKDDEDEDE